MLHPEWCLMGSHTKPNHLGGFENESFVDFREDGFFEALETDMGSDVVIQDKELNVLLETRSIVMNNTSDTLLQSTQRRFFLPIGSVKAGNYIKYDNSQWLAVGYPGNNSIYEKVVGYLCQYNLRWQNKDGKIVERLAYLTSASKYDVGETGKPTISLPSNNFIAMLPEDEETLELDFKRIFIDSRENKRKVYKFTRIDDPLYHYGEHGGIISYILDRDEFNPKADNQELELCDYFIPDEEIEVDYMIQGKEKLRSGYFNIYSATDGNNNLVESEWNIVSAFPIEQITVENLEDGRIKISVDDDELIGEKLKLQMIINGNVKDEFVITISGLF